MSATATRADIARLFGRAAFGATAAKLAEWDGRPYADAVASLFPPGPPGTLGRIPHHDDGARVWAGNINDVPSAQRWWLERMRTTPYPLEERMVLFWHDHFATAATGEPDIALVMQQNETLRTHALGNVRALANAMSIDPAMLWWLNGIANHANGVNENYAREFFELFTLGVLPQVYTETDIRQAARAYTGWVINTFLRAPQFVEARHDLTQKTTLGRTICGYPAGDPRHAIEYQEVTDAALAHNGGHTTARFLAYKLVQHFGYQPDEANLGADTLIADVAEAIRAGWDIAAGVRTMLLHDAWRYAPVDAGRSLVRSPVELVVHGSKVLGIPCDFLGGTFQNVAAPTSERAGHAPFLPPNVGGWPTGRGWLSQSTTLARYDMLNLLTIALRNEGRQFIGFLPQSGDLAGWTAFLGLAELSPATTLRLQEYLASPGTADEQEKQMSMFILVGTSPDWQVM
jgi:uncharacterized protein (DUF1800 family)